MVVGGLIAPLNPQDNMVDALKVFVGIGVSCCSVPLALGGALVLVLTLLRMSSWHLTVTEDKVSVMRGLVRRNYDEIYMRHVSAVSVRKRLFGLIFNCGCLQVRGSGGARLTSVIIGDPYRARRLIYEYVKRR